MPRTVDPGKPGQGKGKGTPPRVVITAPGDTPGQRRRTVKVARDPDGVKRMVIEGAQ